MRIAPVNAKETAMWLTDAATMFFNGFVSGIGSGTIVGGAAAAQSDVMDPETISIRAAIGLFIAATAHGVKRVVVWHDSHPIPNPFKQPDPPKAP